MVGETNPECDFPLLVANSQLCGGDTVFTTSMPAPTRYKLLVRNQLPDVRCSECGAPAQLLCIQCVVEEDRMNFLCTKHIRVHGHDEYGPARKIVNSPRLGMCGYTGPAKPPY